MKHNKFSWVQDFSKHFVQELRLSEVDCWLRDPNIGTQRLRFKVTAVERVRDVKYRIRLIASTSAVEKILSNWGEGQYYILNGKRRRT